MSQAELKPGRLKERMVQEKIRKHANKQCRTLAIQKTEAELFFRVALHRTAETREEDIRPLEERQEDLTPPLHPINPQAQFEG